MRLVPRALAAACPLALIPSAALVDLPQGFGYRYGPGQSWLMNHMIHDLVPNPTDVYITYDLTFLPDSDPAAAAMKPVRTLWLDVAGLRAYPVFDARRQWGRKG